MEVDATEVVRPIMAVLFKILATQSLQTEMLASLLAREGEAGTAEERYKDIISTCNSDISALVEEWSKLLYPSSQQS